MRPALRSISPALAQMVQVVTVVAFSMLTGCRDGEPLPDAADKSGVRVVILADSLVSPMRNYQTILLQRLVRTRPRMEVLIYDAAGDAERQIQQVRHATGEGADFIMIFPQDAAQVAPVLRDALAQGSKVFAFSADIPEDACTCSISSDEHKIGQIAGDFIVSALKTKAAGEGKPAPSGRVVLLRGEELGLASSRRAEGFLQSIQKYPGVVLVHDAPGNWNENDAAARIKEAIRLQKQFDVIYAQNDPMALGAGKAVREFSVEARESMLIMGTDGVPGKGAGVDMVLRGEQEATIYTPPLVDLAWREVQAILDDPGHRPKPRATVKPFLVTHENAPPLQQRGIPMPDVE